MKTKMRVLVIIVSTVFFVDSISYSQELETVGAGVIDFLLTNPKTASQTNATETAALRVIGNLLSISAHRKHEMNVANAGRSEIVINTNSGNQATVYSDTQGNVYLMYNGTIYPISARLVNQAKYETVPIKGSTLPAYNLSLLGNEYRFEKTTSVYFLHEKEATVCDIANKLNISIHDILIVNAGPYYKYSDKQKQKIYKCEKKLIRIESGEYKGFARVDKDNCWGCRIIISLKYKSFKNEIVTTFTCNWKKDFDGEGLDFDDFHGLKRSFYEGEKMLYVMGYTTEFEGTWALEIYEALTGKTVYKKTGIMDKGAHVITVEKEGEKLPPDVYIYSFNLVPTDGQTISKSEKFEIILADEK